MGDAIVITILVIAALLALRACFRRKKSGGCGGNCGCCGKSDCPTSKKH